MENKAITVSGSTSMRTRLPEAPKLSEEKLSKALKADEIVVADCYDDPLQLNTFQAEIARLGRNYGKDYLGEQEGKCSDLFEEVLRAGWTNERFTRAARYLIRQNRFATWTIADWFDAPMQKIFPYSKYIAELHAKGASLNKEIQWYLVGGNAYWAYAKDGDLPFDKIKSHD